MKTIFPLLSVLWSDSVRAKELFVCLCPKSVFFVETQQHPFLLYITLCVKRKRTIYWYKQYSCWKSLTSRMLVLKKKMLTSRPERVDKPTAGKEILFWLYCSLSVQLLLLTTFPYNFSLSIFTGVQETKRVLAMIPASFRDCAVRYFFLLLTCTEGIISVKVTRRSWTLHRTITVYFTDCDSIILGGK